MLSVFQLKSSEQTLKHSHINSTNLSFLEAVVLTVENEADVTAVFKPFFSLGYNSTEFNCIVDIVANHGLCWIKVTARNASALHRIWQGTQSIYVHAVMYPNNTCGFFYMVLPNLLSDSTCKGCLSIKLKKLILDTIL